MEKNKKIKILDFDYKNQRIYFKTNLGCEILPIEEFVKKSVQNGWGFEFKFEEEN